MNTSHNNGPEDRTLDKELQELERAYRRHEAEEPPELLDQAVLNQAHRAVEVKTGWLDFGWIHAATTAAVVVLSFFIIISLRQPEPLEENGLSRSQSVPEYESSADTRGRQAVAEAPKKERRQEESPENQTETRKIISGDSPSEKIQAIQSDAVATPLAEMAVSGATESTSGPPPRNDLDARKASRAGSPGLEEPMAQPASTTFADEATLTEADADEFKADKLEALGREEELLQSIFALKQAGDDRWRIELEAFKELFPDYPLPDQLTE